MTAFRIAILTDLHAGPVGDPASGWHDAFEPARGAALTRAAVDQLRSHDFDVAFVLGDITNHGDDPSFDAVFVELAGLGVPTWVVAGNHDLQAGEYALQGAFDRAPGPLRVPSLAGDVFGDGAIVAGLRFRGRDDDRVELVATPEAGVWGDHPVFLLSHFPIISREHDCLAAGWKYAGDPQGLDGVADHLAKREAPTIALHGHLHLADAVARRSFLQLGFSALIENGHHIALVEIKQDDAAISIAITTIPTSGDARPAAAIGSPRQSWRFAGGEWRS